MGKKIKSMVAILSALSFIFIAGCQNTSTSDSNTSITESSAEQLAENSSDNSSEATSEITEISVPETEKPEENKPQHITDEYLSNTYIATGNNFIVASAENITYRAYFPVEEYGKLQYSFYFSNTVDSTYSKGTKAYVGMPGGNYTISNAVIADGGTGPEDEITNRTPVTFGGKDSKDVTPNETYWSDPVEMDIPEGHYLVWEWTINGTDIPCIAMSSLTSTTSSTDGQNFGYCDNIPLPQIIGAKRDVKHTVCAIGDSITQGCQTEFMKYEFWSAQFAQKIGDDVSFYNAGLGWSRASDASECGDWLERAKKYETVLVAFGTNDIGVGEYNGKKNTAEEIKVFLEVIIDELKEAGCNVILFNSPPQGYKATNEGVRTELNKTIPTLAEEKEIAFFDFAGLLCDESDPGTPLYGGHPNGEAGGIVSDKLLDQFADLLK